MKSNTLTPFELFGNQVRYTVPLFQRPYVWTQTKQWEPLWDDVRIVVERILENKEAQAGGGKPTQAIPHFLGAIVLDQKLVPTGFIQERHVIDGQQRLTTLQLLLDSAHAVVTEHGSETDASALRSLILNDRSQTSQDDQVFKVWPTNYDRDAFRAAMTDGIGIPKSLSGSSIVSAHAFFRNEIEEWAQVAGDPSKVRIRLNALVLALSQYMRLVVIDLEEGDNAQVIFETLNYRGTPLLAADLVKNFIFRRAEAEDLDVESLYEIWWRRFDDASWRKEIGSGRNKRPRIDEFLNYWLVMRTAHEVPRDRIFTDFCDYVRLSERGLVEIVEDMNLHAEVYTGLQELPPHSTEGTFAYRVLDVLGQGVLTPVVLWLLGKPQGVVSQEERELALRSVEGWAMRRMLCRRSTKGIGRFVVDVLEALEDGAPDQPGSVLRDLLLSITSETSDWPGDDEVRSSIATMPIYRSVTRARLRMLLESLEDGRRTSKSEVDHCPRGSLTIEHIMPQGWREHWQLPGVEVQEIESVRRDSLIHTLGNLTVVNNRMNPALSNRPWTDGEAQARGLGRKGKRSILDDNSVLLLNHDVIQGNIDDWREASIVHRTRSLSARILKIWPRPELGASRSEIV